MPHPSMIWQRVSRKQYVTGRKGCDYDCHCFLSNPYLSVTKEKKMTVRTKVRDVLYKQFTSSYKLWYKINGFVGREVAS